MVEKWLTDRQVAARYAVHHVTIWRWLKTDASFPKPIKLSPGCTRWKESEIDTWEAGKVALAS